MDYTKIGKFIQEQRKKLGLTQQQLAGQLKVTNKAISRWETGLGCPDVSLLGELSEILHVGIGELLNGEYNEQLKDNDKFILEAVNYSKQTTMKNIYKKISNVIYIILGFACFSFLVNMIGQFNYFATEKQQIEVDERVSEITDLSIRIEDKVSKLIHLEHPIYHENELSLVISSSSELIKQVDRFHSYQKDNIITIYQEELNSLYYVNPIITAYGDLLFTIAGHYDKDSMHILLYKMYYMHQSSIDCPELLIEENSTYRSDLYLRTTNINLEKYVIYLRNILQQYEIGLDLLLEIGGYHE